MTEPLSDALAQLDFMSKEIATLKKEKEAAEEEAKRAGKRFEAAKFKFLRILQAAGKPYYKSEFGAGKIKQTKTYRCPQDEERKKELFDYLREKELYDNFATIHWQKLSSWVKAEVEAKEKEGEYGFSVPGIGPEETVEATYLEWT